MGGNDNRESLARINSYRREDDLAKFQNNVFSQYGEDGVINEILRRINKGKNKVHWCVEFGAWDGIHLSNTFNLIKNQEFNSVLIEGDKSKYLDLCKNLPSQTAIKICKFVNFDGPSKLDAILAATPIPADFDFLSIDIDGCDYFIFESLVDYRPKLICIEYNPSIPNEVEFIQPRDFRVRQGSSPKSLELLAQSKGYSLVAATYCNLFFVRDEDVVKVTGRKKLNLNDLRNDSDSKTFLFVGFDGNVMMSRPNFAMEWHGFDASAADFQPLPKFIRHFTGNYGFIQGQGFRLFIFVRTIKNRLTKFLRKS